MSRKKFILNDETKINQFGFRVRNSGLKLSRFINNPVILDFHKPGNEAVIGRWENIQIEGHLLTAEAVFDMDDPNAALIAGKVEREFIKGASLGLDPFSMNNFVLAPDDIYDLVEAEIMEASIVAIPNNANALTVKLYATSENSIKEFAENEVTEILLMASDSQKFNLNNSMKKVTLTLSAVAALNLPGNTLEHDENLVNDGIIKLKSELDAEKAKVKAFEDLDKEKKSKLSADAVDADIKIGKIDATKRTDFIKLHAEQPDLYKSIIEAVPEKGNLGAKINNPAGPGIVKTFDDFQKLDLSAQLTFKTTYPNEYQALFK
ncbi:caudovirus prohead protease [Chryseobacterium oncorhynchi]|uniref:Caudovirus prohead protease n=1 Tax=Chryseobacterium oncorhynchi TaxID=741074 RepID=A0A316WPI1_9FLAO|nr:caudovirus prohead protease [Chryseobacterium oncorhynchi]PWN62303.1 caudovirus prohead protease [Chryseobacterium oncorhynchi]